MAYAYSTDREPDDRDPNEQAEREEKLLLMLKAEEEQSLSWAESETTSQQIEALQRYFGEPYGDEEEGRSQVCTREVFETIEWQRNDYARVFAGGGNIISVEETSEADEKYAKSAADYLQWIFFSDNPGFENLDDFTFDGLLHRRGYMAVYWADKEYQAPQTLTGLNILQVAQLQQDPQVEIIGQDFDNESEAGGISLVIRRVKSPARAKIVTYAPEDMRLNGRAVNIDTARYVGCVDRMLCGEAVRLWPDKEEEIVAACGKMGSVMGFTRRSEDVRQERFRDDTNNWFNNGNEMAAEVEVLQEYLRVDLDEDGYPELIRSYRIGDVLLEMSEVEENPFGSWTPIRIPHRHMGLSAYDITQDIQRQNTVIMRAGLDALYQAVVNREAYDRNRLGEDGAAAMMSTVAGTKIPVDGDPATAIKPMVGGVDTTKVAWDALQVNAQRLEDRTGTTRQTRGLDSDQLSREHSGKALGMLQMNADARKEMIARNLASGFAHFMSKVYRLVCRNQNEVRQAKIGGKFCQFDPRTWNSDLRVTIHAGGVNREHALTGLMLIGQEQEKITEALGPGNPNVTIANRYRFQEELCRMAGWRSAEPFFSEPEEQPVMGPDGQPQVDPETGQPKTQPWQPPPQQDPAIAKVQADTQAKQAQMQMDGQKAQADMQLETQKSAAQLQLQREDAAAKIQLAREESAARIQVMREEQALKAQQARDQLALDAQLAREKMEQDYELERLRIESAERVGRVKASSADSEATSVDTDVNGQ